MSNTTNPILSSVSIMEFLKKPMMVLVVFVVAVLLGNCFNLVGWSYVVQIRYYLLMGVASIALSSLYFIQYRDRAITFKYYTSFITLWPFFVLLSSALQGGDLNEDLMGIQTWVFVGAFFMIFYHFRFSEKMILWVLVLYALTTAIIQIMQQIDPLFAVFGGNPDDLSDVIKAEERNGLARFFVGSYHIQMFIMCYFWCKMLKTFRIYWGVLAALLVVSVYLYLTKQILIASVFTLGLSFFMVKERKVKIFASITGILCLIALAIFWEDLFGELIQDSKDDSFSHGIRFEFIAWILEYNLSDPIGVLFGHGFSLPWFSQLQHMLYYPSDIGFLGESIYFGWIWAFAYFFVVFRILITYRNRIPLYVRLFVICSGFISIFIFPYRNRIELFNWVCMLYISSLYIDRRVDMVVEKELLKEDNEEHANVESIETLE